MVYGFWVFYSISKYFYGGVKFELLILVIETGDGVGGGWITM